MKIKGYTLIEIVIVIIILAILAGIGSLVLREGLQSTTQSKDLLEANWQANLALERMSREIREIRSADALNISSNTQITFTDVNGNNIVFSQNGTNLDRNSQVIATGLSTQTTPTNEKLAFKYLNDNYQETTIIDNVRCINITLTIKQKDLILPLQTTICPRNLQ